MQSTLINPNPLPSPEAHDLARLRADIASRAAECRALKRELRTTWTRPMADTQRRLCRLRRRLTELHVFLASRRGRFHVLRAPRDAGDWDQAAWHARIAKRVATEYTVTLPSAEVHG